MKRRTPGTIEDAITIIHAGLGDERCERAVGKSASLVRKWSDPDQDPLPNILQAYQLDSAYMAEYGEAPIRDVYGRILDRLKQPELSRATCLTHAVLMLNASIGNVTAAVVACTDPRSPSGKSLSSDERVTLQRLHQSVVTAAMTLEQILFTPEQKGTAGSRTWRAIPEAMAT